MRLILFDTDTKQRQRFYPLALSRPIWELRCGITTLAEKLTRKIGPDEPAYFVPEYMAAAYAESTDAPVNEPASLRGDDLLLLNPRLKAETLSVDPTGPAEVGVDGDGACLYVRVPRDQAERHGCEDIDSLVGWARKTLANRTCALPTWDYLWDLILAGPEAITADFAAAGQRGIEGSVHEEAHVLGAGSDLYVAPGAAVGPAVVLDTRTGPIRIDARAEVQPFSHIAGPCFIGADTVICGARLRSGNSIGPVCRIGGELDACIFQGYANKYHEGFLGHAYVGEWVNLGALTTNSDLKSDYSSVSVCLDGVERIDTGSLKVGALIGDHAKTSIGTLFNTGAYVGPMAVVLAAGRLIPAFVPSFGYVRAGQVRRAFPRERVYKAAEVMMSRRNRPWTRAQQQMWEAIFQQTKAVRARVVRDD